MPVILVVADVVLANKSTEFQEGPPHAHDVECFVELNLRAVLGIHELNDVEAFRLREPAHVVLGDEELVLTIRWRHEGAQEVDFILSDVSARSEGILTLFALLSSFLHLVNCSLPSRLLLSSQFFFSGDGLRLVLLARYLLLFLQLLLALLEALRNFLPLMLDFLKQHLLLVLDLFLSRLRLRLGLCQLLLFNLLLFRLGALRDLLLLLRQRLSLRPERGLLLLQHHPPPLSCNLLHLNIFSRLLHVTRFFVFLLLFNFICCWRGLIFLGVFFRCIKLLLIILLLLVSSSFFLLLQSLSRVGGWLHGFLFWLFCRTRLLLLLPHARWLGTLLSAHTSWIGA